MAVVRVFYEVSMSLGPKGLSKYLRDRKVKPQFGDYTLFVSKNETKVKILLDSERMFYLRKDSKVTLEELENIPKYFADGWLKDQKVRGSLNEVFLTKRARLKSA